MVRSPKREERRGAAALEFALLLPIIVLLLVGIWEVGRLSETEQLLHNAAREGARRAAGGKPLATGSVLAHEIVDSCVNYMKNAGFDTGNVQVKIENLRSGETVTYNRDKVPVGGSEFDVAQGQQFDQMRVTVSIPFNDVRWVAINRITAADTLSGIATWYGLQDKPFPSFPETPIE